MTIQKKYTKAFKLDAVSLVTEQGYTRAEAARSLDINANMLRRWVKEHQADDGQALRGNGPPNPIRFQSFKPSFAPGGNFADVIPSDKLETSGGML